MITPLTLVKIEPGEVPAASRAASSGSHEAGGSMAMVGVWSTLAPRARRAGRRTSGPGRWPGSPRWSGHPGERARATLAISRSPRPRAQRRHAPAAPRLEQRSRQLPADAAARAERPLRRRRAQDGAPSSLATQRMQPQDVARPPSSVAWAASGLLHDAPSRPRNARSASAQARVCRSSSAREGRQGRARRRPRLDREDPLPDGGDERLGIERAPRGAASRPSRRSPAAARTTASHAAALQLAQPGVDVAAQGLDREVGPRGQDQRPAPRAGGSHHRARRAGRASPRAARVTRTSRGSSRGGKRGQAEAGRQLGGKILEAVHGDVDAPVEQRLLDLAHEEALAAEVGQARRGAAVPLRAPWGRSRPSAPAPAAPRRSRRPGPGPARCRACRCARSSSDPRPARTARGPAPSTSAPRRRATTRAAW